MSVQRYAFSSRTNERAAAPILAAMICISDGPRTSADHIMTRTSRSKRSSLRLSAALVGIGCTRGRDATSGRPKRQDGPLTLSGIGSPGRSVSVRQVHLGALVGIGLGCDLVLSVHAALPRMRCCMNLQTVPQFPNSATNRGGYAQFLAGLAPRTGSTPISHIHSWKPEPPTGGQA